MNEKRIKQIGKAAFIFGLVMMTILLIGGIIITVDMVSNLIIEGINFNSIKSNLMGPILIIVSLYYIINFIKDLKKIDKLK